MESHCKEKGRHSQRHLRFLRRCCPQGNQRAVWVHYQEPRKFVLVANSGDDVAGPTTGVEKVNFDSCMWGAKRQKKTSLLTNMPPVSNMSIRCDGKHEHLPWGVRWKEGWSFATADECEYPPELCNAMAVRAALFVGNTVPDDQPRRRKNKSKPSM